MKAASHKELQELYQHYTKARPQYVAPVWWAESFRESEGEPMTIRRARALSYVMEIVDQPVWPGELVLGAGWAVRMAAAGTVDPGKLKEFEDYLSKIGRRDFGTNSDHHAPDYPALLRLGFGGLKRQAELAMAHHIDPSRKIFLESVLVALDGASAYLRRYARKLAAMAPENTEYAWLLAAQAEAMERLAEEPPRSFAEAVQLVHSYHSMMQIDERYAMAFGRMDQYLYPFFRRDVDSGILTQGDVLQILVHFFEKITMTAGDVQNIAIGGVRPEDGRDATNELSHHILEACKRVGRPGGNITARIHSRTPMDFLKKCGDVIRSGVGYPAVFNDDVQIPALVELGFPLKDARDYCFVGCIEVFIPGRMAPWSDSRFNLLSCVNLALYDGHDSLTGKVVGPRTGQPATFEDFYAAFRTQLQTLLKAHVEGVNAYKQKATDGAENLTSPLMSATVLDCIERGLDVNQGGARYPANHGPAGMGIGVVADSLMAIKQFVYDEKKFTLDELRKILDANFLGFERERELLRKGAPKYGNDSDDVDGLACRVAEEFGKGCLQYRTPDGGQYWGLLAANVQNIPAGAEVGASADGRLAREPLSDAASPTFGRDMAGPTAMIRSVAKIPYRFCPGGNVINMKLSPSVLKGDEGLTALAHLIRACFDLGGIELQFNTIDRQVLQEAMEKPREHENLVTRVSGFSGYFVYLDKSVQKDILNRTEHRALSGAEA